MKWLAPYFYLSLASGLALGLQGCSGNLANAYKKGEQNKSETASTDDKDNKGNNDDGKVDEPQSVAGMFGDEFVSLLCEPVENHVMVPKEGFASFGCRLQDRGDLSKKDFAALLDLVRKMLGEPESKVNGKKEDQPPVKMTGIKAFGPDLEEVEVIEGSEVTQDWQWHVYVPQAYAKSATLVVEFEGSTKGLKLSRTAMLSNAAVVEAQDALEGLHFGKLKEVTLEKLEVDGSAQASLPELKYKNLADFYIPVTVTPNAKFGFRLSGIYGVRVAMREVAVFCGDYNDQNAYCAFSLDLPIRSTVFTIPANAGCPGNRAHLLISDGGDEISDGREDFVIGKVEVYSSNPATIEGPKEGN